MPGRESFAPAAISNFFSVHDRDSPELSRVGATGGGYILSKGVRSEADVTRKGEGVRITVNGDPHYDAKTTARAVALLLSATGQSQQGIALNQAVEVPIGYGFGASAASALSGVRAVASALELRLDPARLAYFAHAADILCRTGLGTVSVIYRFGGAGIITRPGGPGLAEVMRVRVPRGIRIVTAALAPYRKAILLSSPEMKRKVNRLGDAALVTASDLTLESLVKAGELFSRGLGLESPQVRHLAELARENGAIGSSQNMVGHAVHALVWAEDAARVASALKGDPLAPLVEVYELEAASR